MRNRCPLWHHKWYISRTLLEHKCKENKRWIVLTSGEFNEKQGSTHIIVRKQWFRWIWIWRFLSIKKQCSKTNNWAPCSLLILIHANRIQTGLITIQNEGFLLFKSGFYKHSQQLIYSTSLIENCTRKKDMQKNRERNCTFKISNMLYCTEIEQLSHVFHIFLQRGKNSITWHIKTCDIQLSVSLRLCATFSDAFFFPLPTYVWHSKLLS